MRRRAVRALPARAVLRVQGRPGVQPRRARPRVHARRDCDVARPRRRTAPRRPRVGVVKFASCDGCQLTVLDLEDDLLAIAERFDIVEFPEATSRRSAGPFDVLLVEGSISTEEQLEELLRLRRETTTLVTIGACATAGGIQAIRNWSDHGPWAATVYPQPELVDSLAMATPVADHVVVDAELRGCPIDPGQLLELLTALVVGRRPQLPDESVCAECKRRGATCVVVAPRRSPASGRSPGPAAAPCARSSGAAATAASARAAAPTSRA